MAKKTKKSYNGEEMMVGNNTPESSKSDERITKRREEAISLLDEFQQEGSIVEKQIKRINNDLKAAKKELSKNNDELKIIQAELIRRKEQLTTIAKISDSYIDLVCEKFNVKKENIEKIRAKKR